MGTVHIVWAAALRRLGLEAYVPDYTSKKTLSVGVKHSPESICLPYKLILGNFIESIEGGADYVIMITSPGICRLGEYGKSIKIALEDLGYKTNYLELNLYDGFKGMYKTMSEVSGVKNPIKIVMAINLAIKKTFVLDRLETVLSYYRAREISCGQAERAYNRGLKWIDEALTVNALKKAEQKAIDEIKKTQIDANRDILHVDLTGEIYIVQDQFSNQNLERELGKLGVQVRRSLSVSSFLRDAIIPKFFRKDETHLERANRLAKPYLMRDIGGDALECVSDVVYADQRGVDGIIHVSPFTCMPEIMSQNIFPAMREDCKIPILALILDEQSGKAGYITRIEAFVDLMRRRKNKKKIEARF